AIARSSREPHATATPTLRRSPDPNVAAVQASEAAGPDAGPLAVVIPSTAAVRRLISSAVIAAGSPATRSIAPSRVVPTAAGAPVAPAARAAARPRTSSRS